MGAKQANEGWYGIQGCIIWTRELTYQASARIVIGFVRFREIDVGARERVRGALHLVGAVDPLAVGVHVPEFTMHSCRSLILDHEQEPGVHVFTGAFSQALLLRLVLSEHEPGGP